MKSPRFFFKEELADSHLASWLKPKVQETPGAEVTKLAAYKLLFNLKRKCWTTVEIGMQ